MRKVLWVLGGALLASPLCGVAAAEALTVFGAASPLNSNARSDVGGEFSPQVTTDGQGVWVAVSIAEPDSLDECGHETRHRILIPLATQMLGSCWATSPP